jgi:hypothetical protein
MWGRQKMTLSPAPILVALALTLGCALANDATTAPAAAHLVVHKVRTRIFTGVPGPARMCRHRFGSLITFLLSFSFT